MLAFLVGLFLLCVAPSAAVDPLKNFCVSSQKPGNVVDLDSKMKLLADYNVGGGEDWAETIFSWKGHSPTGHTRRLRISWRPPWPGRGPSRPTPPGSSNSMASSTPSTRVSIVYFPSYSGYFRRLSSPKGCQALSRAPVPTRCPQHHQVHFRGRYCQRLPRPQNKGHSER